MRCTQGFKRVPSVYGGTVRRCRGYGGSRRKATRRRRGKSRTCKGFKSVYSRSYRKRVLRCADYTAHRGGGRRRSSSSTKRRRTYGRRPFNKGKTCARWGYKFDPRTGTERRYCASYGANPAWRTRGKKRRGPTWGPGRQTVAVPRGYTIVSQPPPSATYAGRRPGFWTRLLGS